MWQMIMLALCFVWLWALIVVGGRVSDLAQLWKPMMGKGAAKSA